MDDGSLNAKQEHPGDAGERLESWKAIADFFGRTTTTVQRWEQSEGLPVHRLGHVKKGSVFAFKHELEEWRRGRTQGPGSPVHDADAEPTDAGDEGLRLSPRRIGAGTVLAGTVGLLTIAIVGLAWLASRAGNGPPAPPTNLTVLSRFPGSVSLAWSDNSSTETRFEIRRFDQVVATTPANVVTTELTGLDAGTSYHWDLRACNASGCSPWHGVLGKTPTGEDALTGVAPPSAVGGANDILFSRRQDDGTFQIHLMRPADGWMPIRLTNTSANERTPAWSPDRTKIAFASDRGGFAEIYVMNADGSHPINLTNRDPAYDRMPTWSPDGTRIAFASTRSGDYEIWMMHADGSAPINLTKTPGSDLLPAWSPDGRHIAFVSDRHGDAQVYVMQSDGSKQTPLTTGGGDNGFPAWSPDGSRIAYRSRRDGNSEIYVMNADGSHQTNLTNHAAEDEMPTWSPDGTRIAFRSNRDGHFEIFSMNADGSGVTKLTHYGGGDDDPNWGWPPYVTRNR